MSKEAGAGAPENEEIEITPEMIEAGVKEIASYNSNFESPEDAVIRIFCAMIETAPNGGHHG